MSNNVNDVVDEAIIEYIEFLFNKLKIVYTAILDSEPSERASRLKNEFLQEFDRFNEHCVRGENESEEAQRARDQYIGSTTDITIGSGGDNCEIGILPCECCHATDKEILSGDYELDHPIWGEISGHTEQ